MAYYGLVTKLHNVRKDENSDRLYLADCFGEGVIVGSNYHENELVLYLPTDGKVERWFGDKLSLFRKNEDGTPQGGYLDDNGHVKAIKLRGNQSSGIVIKLDTIRSVFNTEINWKNGDKVTSLDGEKDFCKKYVPNRQRRVYTGKEKKVRKPIITYPEFSEHVDTAQLAYNLNQFHVGDVISFSLKMHGTSQRSMKTYSETEKKGFTGLIRKILHLPPKMIRKKEYVCGTRRTVVRPNSMGYYKTNEFRIQHHKKIEPFVEEGMEVFYEIVGYYGNNPTDTIMAIGDNKKIKDKSFTKRFGEKTVFSYGCEVGQSEMYVYRITANNGEIEYTPYEIIQWCKKAGVKHVPFWGDNEYISYDDPNQTVGVFTSEEDLMKTVNDYLADDVDPIGGHLKEGIVVRIVNRRIFTAFKAKTYNFKVLEGIIKDDAVEPDMEEAEDANEEI